MKPIPYGKQLITQEDIDAVVNTLQSDYLTQGPKIKQFEDAFTKYIGCKYAVAVANGTAALHLGALALGVKEGDKVITTPITFAASANCVRYCGGEVVFADIDPANYLLDINEVRRLLEKSPKGTYRGIIPVDFAGRAVHMESFRKLADEFGLWIMEDACHAPGGYFTNSSGQQQRCGNGEYADVAIFSFHPVKHIAAGEGGMITTNDRNLYEQLLILRTHGITRNPDLFENTTEFATGIPRADSFPGWYMEMQTMGYNYRLTDFQAALGISQLNRAEEGLVRRRQIARRYDESFKGHPDIYSQLNEINGDRCAHAYHLYVIEVKDRLALYNHLHREQIYAQVHYIPVHLMPYYRKCGWKEGDFVNAERYYSRCLSLPMYPSLTDDQQTFVIDSILRFFA